MPCAALLEKVPPVSLQLVDVLRMAPQIPYPVLLDERAEALKPWNVQGYPRTYLVDAEGKLRQVFVGGLSGADLEEAIRPLLPASCPES